MAIQGIRLNDAPAALFKTNGNEREDIIAGARLLMADYHGNTSNKLRNNNEYTPMLTSLQYKELNEQTSKKMILFAAKVAANGLSEEVPASYEDFLRTQKRFFNNGNFLRVLSGIIEDVVSPMLPFVSSNALGELAETVTVGIGKSYEITVKSNDAFLFQDSSWGASRSVPKNYLYDDVITLNPTPRSAGVKIKWYQLVGNNGSADIGRFLNALAAGMSNKILALWNNAMTSATANAKFVPAYLRFAAYNTANWVSCSKAVSQANGVDRTSLMAFGDFTALSKILPSGTTQDAALSTLLGAEWFSRGYLGTVMGVPTAEINNAYVAGTVNLAAPTALLPTNAVYMVARGGEGYKPIYIAFEDSPITLEMTPDKTGDQTIDVNMTFSVDAAPVFGSKVGVITVS